MTSSSTPNTASHPGSPGPRQSIPPGVDTILPTPSPPNSTWSSRPGDSRASITVGRTTRVVQRLRPSPRQLENSTNTGSVPGCASTTSSLPPSTSTVQSPGQSIPSPITFAADSASGFWKSTSTANVQVSSSPGAWQWKSLPHTSPPGQLTPPSRSHPIAQVSTAGS